MTHNYIYLKDGKIYGSVNEMPETHGMMRLNTEFAKVEDKLFYEWQQSLTELECDESELAKIAMNIKAPINFNNPIDITSITTVKDGKVYFKDPENESNEAIEFAEWIRKNNWEYSLSNRIDCWFRNMGKYKTTEELYEIFKNK